MRIWDFESSSDSTMLFFVGGGHVFQCFGLMDVDMDMFDDSFLSSTYDDMFLLVFDQCHDQLFNQVRNELMGVPVLVPL